MPLGDDLVELLEQRVELGRRHLGVLLAVDERRRARLSMRSRVSDRKTVNRLSLEVVDEPEQLLPLALQERVVDAAVARVERRP